MALTVQGLSVALGRRTVLHDVDAAFRPGRITAVLGPNGAGKSTLVKAMAALLPHRGEVRLDERMVAALDPRERARLIGYLPQDAVVHWNMRVDDVVALGRMPHGDRCPRAIGAALCLTDTADLADRPVGELSGGERSRVLLARVLAGEPRWLLADEPLASLDPAHAIDMLDRLRQVAREGMGVVVVLHDLVQAARIADDVLLLDTGRVAAFGPAALVLTPELVGRVFGVEVALIERDGRHLPVPLGRLGG
ncbi:ABC transporter ATP-binding protein [Sphingomonas sp. KR1UV-12]|uniref:ABC transporter ATP-binding protein n=1 Tax=Sphingomonas aurea TaxID=3063994 RepID=A0ABT9EFW3_9SPHN|nr:ABC transporter ATP-binding protein [Sphingomonas sp. KR1UV-12]MDP1025730.1 ABC transporter ATP-binding protein [Sphingomonas sp. KR1UV-12]